MWGAIGVIVRSRRHNRISEHITIGRRHIYRTAVKHKLIGIDVLIGHDSRILEQACIGVKALGNRKGCIGYNLCRYGSSYWLRGDGVVVFLG